MLHFIATPSRMYISSCCFSQSAATERLSGVLPSRRAGTATGARALAAETLALITFVAADDFELTRTIMLTLEGLQSGSAFESLVAPASRPADDVSSHAVAASCMATCPQPAMQKSIGHGDIVQISLCPPGSCRLSKDPGSRAPRLDAAIIGAAGVGAHGGRRGATPRQPRKPARIRRRAHVDDSSGGVAPISRRPVMVLHANKYPHGL